MPIARFVRRRGLRGVFFLKKNRLAQIFFRVLQHRCTRRSCAAKIGVAMLRAHHCELGGQAIFGLTRIARRIGSFILGKRLAVVKDADEHGASCKQRSIGGAFAALRGRPSRAHPSP
jgi:hypothetical protein